MSSETMHEVKSAAAILADDVICQSFVQSSSTLAYACLLIRQGKYDLAVHILHSLEAKQASRFKDMVFYLQAQIGIETGDYGTVKKRLVPRVNQHPNDMVALSLLECAIYHEWIEWAKTRPQEPVPAPASRPFAVPASDPPPVIPGPVFGNAEAASAASHAAAFSKPAPEPAPVTPAAAAPGAHPMPSAPASGADVDLGIYQALANDPNTRAMVVWNASMGKLKATHRHADLEALATLLPRELPASLQAACAALEGGSIHKICFSFQNLTVTSFHAGAEGVGLVTGNINQSLLSIVRAENTFRKQAFAAASPRPAEFAPNE